MSYIDTFDHEFVGFFAGLPLYHPLVDVPGTQVPEEFSCSRTQLILGGGDGEHPALIVADAESVTLNFLSMWLRLMDIPHERVPQEVFAVLDNAAPPWQCLQFADWDIETYDRFYHRCVSASFPSPFLREKHGSLEDWIVGSIGEFLYFSLIELSATARSKVPALIGIVQTPIFFNVLIAPPGYKVLAGRYHNELGEVVWGNYRWDRRDAQDAQC